MTIQPPLPYITRLAVPAKRVAVPEGFSRARFPIDRGMPATLQLTQEVEALAIIAGGLARAWETMDSSTVVHDPAISETSSAMPIRLLFRMANKRLGVVPLALGPTQMIGQGEAGYLAVQFIDWKIHAGSIRGGGDFGSFVELGWRHSRERPAEFVSPAAGQAVLRRLANTPRPWFEHDPRLIEAAQDGPDNGARDLGPVWRGYGLGFGDA